MRKINFITQLLVVMVVLFVSDLCVLRDPKQTKAIVELEDEQVALSSTMRKSNSTEMALIEEVSCVEENIVSSDFVRTDGTSLVLNGNKYIINGVCASNEVARNPLKYNENMMKEEDYQEIAALGMNTVRFMFNHALFETPNNPYLYKDTAWEWIDMNIAWAEKYGIKIILDCHIPQGWDAENKWYVDLMESEELQKRYIYMWKSIAERYSDCITVLGYGLINEPKVTRSNSQAWSILSKEVAEEIRKVDKNHILIVQSANIIGTSTYVRPDLGEEDNWMIEIHRYPISELTMLTEDAPAIGEKIGYTNDYIAWIRKGSKDNGRNYFLTYGEGNVDWNSSEWSQIQGIVDVTDNSNNANLLIILYGLEEGQKVYCYDLRVNEYVDGVIGKEVYNSNNNVQFQYAKYAPETGTSVLSYPNNIVVLEGKQDKVMFADKSYGRYFTVDSSKQYYISFKIKVEGGSVDNLVIEPGLKFYISEEIYMINNELLDFLLNYSELQEQYNVPVFMGEIGTTRYAYENVVGIEQLVDDIFVWLKENECNFTWFTWHEPNFGIYTNSGLEGKNNLNVSLLNKIKDYMEKNKIKQ